MLVNLTEILSIAEEQKIAVGSFNTPNLESLLAVIGAAEELNVPVIVQFAQCHESWMPLSVIGPIMVEEAKKASVPVCVHLDHGETLAYLKQALELGFTGIMYDGSVLPYEENVRNTKSAVAMAARYNCGVEAELGSMGKRESGSGEDGAGVGDDTKIYTDPVLAKEFVSLTGVDALACSFGTTHGIYLEEPKLDFDVVRKVREETEEIPVVMHGGSGVSKEDFREGVRAGVRKVNYFTYMDKCGGTAAEEYIHSVTEGPKFFSSVLAAATKAMKENVKEAMKTFAMMD